jgi:hypothetical protein
MATPPPEFAVEPIIMPIRNGAPAMTTADAGDG